MAQQKNKKNTANIDLLKETSLKWVKMNYRGVNTFSEPLLLMAFPDDDPRSINWYSIELTPQIALVLFPHLSKSAGSSVVDVLDYLVPSLIRIAEKTSNLNCFGFVLISEIKQNDMVALSIRDFDGNKCDLADVCNKDETKIINLTAGNLITQLDIATSNTKKLKFLKI